MTPPLLVVKLIGAVLVTFALWHVLSFWGLVLGLGLVAMIIP